MSSLSYKNGAILMPIKEEESVLKKGQNKKKMKKSV